MDTPIMLDPRQVLPETHVISAYLPIPGLGMLPANAFVIQAAQPVLVDAGVLAMGEAFFEHICRVVNPEDLRWIWLTHTDPDHIGCLRQILEAAPRARIVTTFLGMGKLGLAAPVPPERIYLLNPGQRLDVGDRQLLAVRPPAFDAPETTGFFDSKSRALFSSDCFGALMSRPADSASEIPASELGEGLVTWTGVDAPWLSFVDPRHLDRALADVLALKPSSVLSSHLPPAPGMASVLVEHLSRARTATPFVGPDQAALVQMMSAA